MAGLNSERRILWPAAVLIALLFSVTNLPWTLDDYDQAKQAFTSFEMVQEGHWLYQHTPNERIATKPPLVGWISAALYGITRSWEIAWRLPSLLAAGALAVVLHRHGGLLALSAFGLNLLSPRLATLVRTDMPLALVVFLVGLRIWQKVRNAEPWHTRDRVLIFLLLSAGIFIKGPIVYAFLLPGLIAFVWWKGGSAWPGWWPWIGSLALFLLWVAAGIKFVPGFYEEVVLREFLGRFGETVHRPQPFYFYIPHLLHKFAPWSMLLVAAATMARRHGRAAPEVLWLGCWVVGALIVMSVIPSKRVDRIFPIVPPLCLLLSVLVARLTNDLRKWILATLVFASLFTSGYAAQRIIIGFRSGQSALVRFGAAVRAEAAQHGWRYEVVGGREEGLLPYLRKLRFVKPADAVELWNAHAIDALVVPADEMPSLSGAVPAGLDATVTSNGQTRRYLLLRRG